MQICMDYNPEEPKPWAIRKNEGKSSYCCDQPAALLHFIPWSKAYNKPEDHCSSSSDHSYYLNITGKHIAVLRWEESSSIIILANALRLLLFNFSSNITLDSMVSYGLILTVCSAVLRLHPGKAIHQNLNEFLSLIAQKQTLNFQVKSD